MVEQKEIKKWIGLGVRENQNSDRRITTGEYICKTGHYCDDCNWFEDYILYLNYLNTEHFFGKRNHIIT